MEWRVFIPNALDPNVVPASDARHDKLRHSLQLTQALIPGIDSIPSEQRDDSYIVVNRHCGLKFRSGKKLEIKIRRPCDNHIGVEKWAKTKLKKKAVSEQMESILQLLKEYGHSNIESFEPEIHRERSITISKSRINVSLQLAVVELCQIRVEDCNHIHPAAVKEWTSVAVEADDVEDIQNVLASASFKALMQSLHNLNQEARSLPLYPVICGYPFWVQYLTGQYSEEDLASVRDPLQHLVAL